MIVICEPICKAFSHEKVNSGFIYGLRLAYPNETLRFYAHASHIKSIKEILAYDKVVVENIEYIAVNFKDSSTIGGALKYYFSFKKIFYELKKVNTDKIFFLSYSPLIIYLIKKLKQHKDFLDLKFSFVLHGDFENIKTDTEQSNELKFPTYQIKQNKIITLIQRIRKNRLADYPSKIIKVSIRLLTSGLNKFRIDPSKRIHTKDILLWRSSPDFRYIALSPHIVKNAAKYIDIEKLNIQTVLFPTNFAKPLKQPDNEYVKFGIFGYGDSLVLSNIALKLSKKNIKANYEIRIIGMDNRGVEDFKNITAPSSGKPLARIDMEKYAEDIDVFLILYGKNKYKLGCSGSIIESLSYIKPILHFENDCINSFNRLENPIGVCCNSIDQFVDKMIDIIENYKSYSLDFTTYRNNIIKLRDEHAITNSLAQLRKSFTW